MQTTVHAKPKFLQITATCLIAAVILSRLTSYFYSVTYTDIAFADWVPTLLSYAAEIFVASRTVIALSAVAFAAYFLPHPALTQSIVLVGGTALLDYAARFLIDLLTNSIDSSELFAAIWLLLQFAYELILLALAVILLLAMKKKYTAAETSRTAAKFTCIRAIRYAVLLVLFMQILLQGIDIADFLTTYTGITNTEIASMVGQTLKVIVIYGGVSLVLAEGIYAGYEKALLQPAPEEENV